MQGMSGQAVACPYLRREPSSAPALQAEDRLLYLLLLLSSFVSLNHHRGGSCRCEKCLRRAIEVVKGREAKDTIGLATARRERANAERRRSTVGAMVGGQLLRSCW